MTISSNNSRYIALLNLVRARGARVSPRGQACLEVCPHHTTWDMSHPTISIPQRKLSYPHLYNEALWILRGSNRLSELTKYCERMSQFSDDGLTLSGAYGPPVTDQLRYVRDSLMADECTRQAVISIWRPCPRPSKDIPCTLSLQFLLRDNIHMDCVASMRSSDSYLGIPYDIFTFSMISWYIALMIYFESDHVVHPRHLHIVAGSQHLYERDLGKVEHCNSWTDGVNFDHDYIQMTHPDELLEHLEQRRDDAYNRQQLTRDQ